MDKPLVTICCITYNHEKYIKQCLDGFLMQKTNFTYEIVIHDDASTDRTVEIIQEYVERHPGLFVPIYQEENQYSKKIKPLIKYVFPKARGKYLAICEGDDYWIDPEKLQRQVDFLENNDAYGMTFTAANYFIQKNGRIVTPSQKINYSTPGILKANPIRTLTTCFRTDLMRECCDFFSSRPDCPILDFSLFLWFSTFSKVNYEPIVTSTYRQVRGSVSRSSNIHGKVHFLEICQKIRRYWISNFLPDVDADRIEGDYFLRGYQLCLFYDVKKEYINYYREYLLAHPSIVDNHLIKFAVKSKTIESLISKSIWMARYFNVK